MENKQALVFVEAKYVGNVSIVEYLYMIQRNLCKADTTGAINVRFIVISDTLLRAFF